MKRTHEINMTEGAILPKLLQYSMPILFMSILQNLFNAADIVIVGKFVSSKAMAAVGSTTTLLGFLVSLFSGIATGNNILCARYFGKRDLTKLSQCLHTAILLGLFFSLPIAVFGIVFSVPLLRLINTDPLITDMAALYLRIYFLGVPADMVFNFAAAGVRATGNSRLPTVYLSIAGLTNLILNCVFVLVFGMDVDGVALATVISKYLAVFLLFRFMLRTTDSCRLELRKLKITKGFVPELLKLGIPAGINGSLTSFANMIMVGTINLFGYATTAGNSAANSIMSFVYSAFGAVSSAVGCFAGQNVGAGTHKRIPKLILRSMSLCIFFAFVFSSVFHFFGEELLSLFVSANDPERDLIISQGMLKLMYVGYPIYFYGLYSAQTGILGGFGRTFTAMLVSLFSIFCVRVAWCKFLFPFLPQQIQYVYLCLPVSMIFATILYGVAIFFVYRTYVRNLSQRLSAST